MPFKVCPMHLPNGKIWFKRLVHIIFQVLGPTAMMITVVNFTFLSANPSFYNLLAHLATSFSFLIEMSLNSMGVRLHDWSYSSGWCSLYMAFIWTVVASGYRHWPYSFLKVDSWACILW